jgi:sugar/nucleoside kinase (ribokinase family)
MDPALVEVVHVGSACRDVAPDDARGWRLGGGVAYAALTTARLGIPTAAIIGVDAVASDALELDRLAEAGVAILRIPLAEGPIFDNRETPIGRVQTCVAVGVPLPIPGIPAAWLRAPGWSLVPVAGELDDAWAALVSATASLAVAWQGFLRELVAGREVVRRMPEKSAVLGRADLVGVSRDDVAVGTSEETLWRLLHPGAALLLTDGSAGGAWIQVGPDGPDGPVEVTRYGAIPPTDHVDPTGAGDVVLAALHAVMLKPSITGFADPDRQAMLRFAAAAGSLVVEGRGLDGVPWLDDVLRRAARA